MQRLSSLLGGDIFGIVLGGTVGIGFSVELVGVLGYFNGQD